MELVALVDRDDDAALVNRLNLCDADMDFMSQRSAKLLQLQLHQMQEGSCLSLSDALASASQQPGMPCVLVAGSLS